MLNPPTLIYVVTAMAKPGDLCRHWNLQLTKGKGKWSGAVIFNSQKRSVDERGGDSLRCHRPNKCLVTYVRGHLQVDKHLPTTKKPTVENTTSVVNSATSHFVRIAV